MRVLATVIVLLASMLSATGWAQRPSSVEELQAALSGASEPARRLPLLIALSAGLVERDPENAVASAEQAVEIAETLSDRRAIADASLNLGRALLRLGRRDRATIATTRALDLYRDLGLPGQQAEAGFTRANIAFARGEYREALRLYDPVLKLIDAETEPARAAAVVGYVAHSWLMLGDSDEAARVQARALELRRKAGDEAAVAAAQIVMGAIEHSRGALDAAAAAYLDALSTSERLGNLNDEAAASLNLGLLMIDRNDLEEADRRLSRAIELTRRLNEPVRLAAALRGLGQVRGKQSRAAEAQSLLEQAELNENANRRLVEAEVRYEREKKARDVERLERDREVQNLILERQRLIRNAAIGGLALIGALFVVALNAYRVKKRSALQLAAKNEDLTEANRIIAAERARSESLLLSILPPAIAARLKQSHGAIADSHASATVLFADIVGFTSLSRRVGPAELVRLLDQMFSRFDALANRHRLEKIKTIGDCYMVVGGVPEAQPDHCERVAAMALDLLDDVKEFNRAEQMHVSLRIGFHIGPVVAGVIGRQKFSYDLWGDTVNTASRLESAGAPGRIHVSEDVARALAGKFAFESRGMTEVKGVGLLPTYFLLEAANDRSGLARAAG